MFVSSLIQRAGDWWRTWLVVFVVEVEVTALILVFVCCGGHGNPNCNLSGAVISPTGFGPLSCVCGRAFA